MELGNPEESKSPSSKCGYLFVRILLGAYSWVIMSLVDLSSHQSLYSSLLPWSLLQVFSSLPTLPPLLLPGNPSLLGQQCPLACDLILTSGRVHWLFFGSWTGFQAIDSQRYLGELTAWHRSRYTCNTIWQSLAWLSTIPKQLNCKENLICSCQSSNNTGPSVTTQIIQRDILKYLPISS